MAIGLAETISLRESDTLLPVVPMFHANAWGLAHAAPTFGAKLVMPGPFLQGKPLCDMLEKVCFDGRGEVCEEEVGEIM